MGQGMNHLIHRLYDDRSISINRMGAVCIKDSSEIDIYNMQLSESVSSYITNIFDTKSISSCFICGCKSNEYIKLDDISVPENTKLYLFFAIECDKDVGVIICAKNDLVSRTWINGRFVASHPSPLITELKRGRNIVILESWAPNEGACVNYRVNTLANEYRMQNLSYLSGNLQEFSGRFWWLNKEYDNYGKGRVEYILLPLDEVNIDINQKMDACIYSYDPPELLDSFDNYFYKTHSFDLSKYDYPATDNLNHLIFEVTCHTKDGKTNTIQRTFFLYPIINQPQRWVDAAYRLMDSGELTAAEYNYLGFHIQAVTNPDITLREGRDEDVKKLAEAIENVKSGLYLEKLYLPGHKKMYFRSEMDQRFLYINIYLPDTYTQEEKYPLLLMMMTNCKTDYEKAFVMEQYRGEAVISADIPLRGVTLGSYVGEAAFLEILSQLKQWLYIDEKRIYMVGYSSGGFAAFAMAQAMPHLFAGICSSGATAYDPEIKNLSQTRVINIISQQDLIYNKKVSGLFQKLPDYIELITDKTVHADLENLYLNKKVINQLLSSHLERYPTKISFHTEKNRHLRVYWIRLHSITNGKTYADIKAEIVGNDIVISCKNATGLTIDLPPQINRNAFTISINKKIFKYHNYADEKIHFIHKTSGYYQSETPAICSEPYKGNGLLDVYLDPLCILCCDVNNAVIISTSKNFSEPYVNGFDSKIHVKYPIFTLHTITKSVLYNHSLIIVDYNIKNDTLMRLRQNCPVITDERGYVYGDKRYDGAYSIMQIVQNPWNPQYNIVYVNTNDAKMYSKNLFTRKLILPTYVNGQHPYLNKCVLILDQTGYKVLE
ncbi:MAG: hypothetical protein HFE78_04705 [Clostridiales bacterium]|nr:hypothetical protein [Clostridiales bacterium]